MRKIIAICLSMIFIASVITACVGRGGSEDYVLLIDGDKISKTEYMVYLYEQKKSFEEKGGEDIWEVDFDGMSAEEVAKQNAMNSILVVKAAVKQHKNLGVTLSDEEKVKVNRESNELLEELDNGGMPGVNAEYDDIYRIIEESHIQQAVFEFVTNGFESSESDFEAYLQEHYELYKKQYNKVTVQYIYAQADTADSTTNKELMDKAYSELMEGADFEAVQEKYSMNVKKESFELSEGTFESNVEDPLYSMSEGAITPVLSDSQGYYIFKIIDVINTDIDSIRDSVEVNYIKEKKQEIYQSQTDKWQADMTVEKNQEQWDSIHI